MMFTCSSCSSFVPPKLSVCPACRAEVVHSTGARVVAGVLTLAGGSVFAMTLTACYGAINEPYYPDSGTTGDAPSSCTAATDTDADGYCGAEDCNDTNANIHVGATETIGDGVDSDCGGGDGTDL